MSACVSSFFWIWKLCGDYVRTIKININTILLSYIFFFALYFRFYFTVCLEWTPSISSVWICVWIWHVLQWNRKINYLWIWVHFYCKDMNFPQLSSVKFRQEVWQIFEKYPKRTRNFFVGISKCTIEIIETRQDL